MSALRFPQPGSRLRAVTLLYGVSLFFWLGLEDNHTITVVLLGWGFSLLGLLWWTLRRTAGKLFAPSAAIIRVTLLGAGVGGGAVVATMALMFFKNARHAHIFPDFPPQMLIAVWERFPVWMAAGGLIGAAAAFVWLAVLPQNQD